MAANLQSTILELRECRAQLALEIESAREHGQVPFAELRTAEAALTAIEERIQELLSSN